MESSGTFHSDLKAAVMEKDANITTLCRRRSEPRDVTQDEAFNSLRLAIIDYLVSRVNESKFEKTDKSWEYLTDHICHLYRKKFLQLIIDM